MMKFTLASTFDAVSHSNCLAVAELLLVPVTYAEVGIVL